MHVAIKLLLAVLVLVSTGCGSMCNSTLDCDYHAFGGMRDRHDRTNGRVASLFDPAAAAAAVLPAQEPLPPEDVDVSDDSTQDGPGDGVGEESTDESELRDELMEQLDDLDPLQELDDEPATGGGADSDTGLNEI